MKKRSFFDNAYLSKVALSVAASIFAAGVLFYVGYHLSGNMKAGIDTFFARAESYDDPVKCRGYILKDETAISNPYSSSSLCAAIANGGRVSSGGKVADAYTTASDTISQKISLVEEQIEFYEDCRDTHATIGDSGTVKKEIASAIFDIRRAAEKGDLKSTSSAKRELLMNISSLGVMTGKVTDFNSRIATLNSELATLKSSLGALVGSIYSPSAGYYFAECDGYEGILTSVGLDSATYSSLSEMLSAADAYSPAVSSSDAGKIMHTFKWYVACPMTSTEASRLTSGYSYTVTLGNNESTPLTMKIYSILSNGADSIVVLECSTVNGSFDFTRVQDVSITVETIPCFAVPVSAIRYYDGMRGVYVLNKTTVTFRRVSIFDERDGYYLCYAEDPTDYDAAFESDDTEAAEETTAETAAEETYYSYLKENDIVITTGTGLYVGMVYNAKK